MVAGPIRGMEGVMVAARQTARGRPVGVHLPVGFYRLPICRMREIIIVIITTINNNNE